MESNNIDSTPKITNFSKMLLPEIFIMSVDKFNPEDFSEEDKEKMIFLWKYFFTIIKKDVKK